MKESFKNIIDSAQSILILIPTKPFFDQVAAALSFFLALREQKSVNIVSPTDTTVEFNRLIGVNRISKDVGNKNLVISFAGYKAEDIERVSYDIENAEFRLTVIPKPGFPAPQKEQVNHSYAGVASDLVILVGGANESHFPALLDKDIAGARIVHIGNKQLSADPAKKIVSFAGDAPAVSEVAAYLINEAQLKVTSDVATNLLMGIESATDNFSPIKADAQTFQLAASLMQLGGKRLGQQAAINAKDFPAGSIPGQGPQQPQPTQQTTGLKQSHGHTPQGPTTIKPVQKVDTSQQQVKQDDEVDEKDAPRDWLKPKIYKSSDKQEVSKGTSIK